MYHGAPMPVPSTPSMASGGPVTSSIAPASGAADGSAEGSGSKAKPPGTIARWRLPCGPFVDDDIASARATRAAATAAASATARAAAAPATAPATAAAASAASPAALAARGRPSSAGRALQDARQADELCRPSSAGRIGSEWRSSFGGKLPLFSFYRYSRFPLFPFYRIDEDCNLVQPQLGATWCLVCPLFSFSRSGPNRPVVSRSGTSPEFWLKPILVRFQWRARFKYGSRWSAAIRARPCGFKTTTPSTT